MTAGRIEYRVVWRRRDWISSQSRVFQTRHAALTLLDKLSRTDRPDLSTLVEVRLWRRTVGPWEDEP